jgi:murein L,D-transpeptidase YafK
MFRLPVVLMILAPLLLHAQQNQRVPAYLLEIPESVGTILIAETATSTLHQFQAGENGATRQGESYMSVGQNGVGKERAWDRKTPLGIYFINDQLDTSKLHEKYGPTAFSLDYPNIWDRSNRRSGDGIWIHGVTPNSGRRPPLDTDGCIALPNDELLALEEALEPLVTPVLIARKIRWTSPELLEFAHAELRLALDTWVSSYASGDLHRYLSLYGDDFSYRGMNRDEWVAYRTQSITRAPAQRVELDDVLLLVDPEDSALYLARFRQEIVYEDRTITTVKRLYWRRSTDGDLRIVAEDNG